jgi:hypothetical protein
MVVVEDESEKQKRKVGVAEIPGRDNSDESD